MITGLEKVPEHLQKYIDYINNTGQVPLHLDIFDDDHEPVGEMVRAELHRGGFIYYDHGGRILLRPDLATKETTQ